MSNLLDAVDVQNAWQRFCDAVVPLGFDKMIYGSTRVPSRGIIGDPADALILHHGPQAYADRYLGEQLYLQSATYRWAENHTGFCSWPKAIAQIGGLNGPGEERILALNAEFGVYAGFVGSLKGVVPGMRGAIGLSPTESLRQKEANGLWSEVGEDIELLAKLLHLRISTLPQNGQRRPLTSRQREVLQWYSRGKTMQDIAAIMGVSTATVEKHLRMVREALDAQTTAHAVQKATALNLLNQES